MIFSLIIPAFNEDEHIVETIEKTINVPWNTVPEIIIVDDGSRKKLSDTLSGLNDKVKITRHEQNRGYGAALKTGIKYAKNETIVIIDADGTYPFDEIENLVELYEEGNYDMVVGSRLGDDVFIPNTRRPAKWVLGKLANFVAGERIPDLNSGLRVFSREVFLCMRNLLPNGFSFTTTITLAMLINGYSVKYHPINYYPRKGQSKIRPFHDTINFVQLILNISLYFAPRKIFLSISCILFFVALFWAFFSKFYLGQLADVSTIVIIMTAIQIASVGLLAELINMRIPNFYEKDM